MRKSHGQTKKKRPLERDFQRRVIDDLRGIDCWFVKIQTVAVRGVPDIIGCINGQFFALELKRDERSRPTALQEYNLEKIHANGGIATVAYPSNWEDVLARIEQAGKSALEYKGE